MVVTSKAVSLPGLPPVQIQRNVRSKRTTLRIDQLRGQCLAVAPTDEPDASVVRFILNNEGWIRTQLNKILAITPLALSKAVPYRGRLLRVRHVAGLATPYRDGTYLCVGGRAGSDTAVRTWLRGEATRVIREEVRAKAQEAGRTVRNIHITDTTSRWGSCNSAQHISISWRMIMAPPEVLSYLVAHEVAHLVHMDHSRNFWKVCEQLTPHRKMAESWLRREGAALLRIGRV